ncbi:cysteine-rich motor neuron 1 protein-like isoform X1 [Lepisosteus oculatus]|uniref:cysteine-rich motor neuron 1 protein-like isoform X1 n=1 Tax=Lepisosteus oculatus TaxID=7918 RepID=UPI000740140D|nr:PREDICTED: cysteine-rich motor neuron 1 protein-like isoform X1 [Lepisosteus oculatus]
MYNKYFKVVFLIFSFLARVLMAYECTPCELRTCVPHTCENGRTPTRDPCGCCDYCTRLEWEPCGGEDWSVGYCGLGLTCAGANGTRAATVPDVGICKVLPEHLQHGAEDKKCPEQSGCNRTGGQCTCETLRTCVSVFEYPDMESCLRASIIAQLKCTGVTCPSHPIPDCPKDSALTKSYTPPAGCCPTVPPLCTCNFRACQKQECPAGQQQLLVRKARGIPGDCCDVYECQKVSPKCVHDGKEFSDGEVYRMDTCWLCQCRGGISFCSKAECAGLDCENFYIPEGECCPVCLDVELLSLGNTDASCWVNNKLRQHEEQWKEDDCTFCQCVNGDPHCTAMACKQTCQSPVKIPGECCPFCEEPTYETVSPILCPKLENCFLSERDCPYGFVQDRNGCLLCQCLTNDSCPDLGTHCSLQCPFGFEKDIYGCEVCECTTLTPKCRPVSCSKTCPHGYVRNKHGCEMCRCVKCPPFTCDKDCREGYKQNKKGCSICVCKETSHTPSTTVPAPTASYCLTANGQRYKEGESWHDGCRDCYCHDAREMCLLITCPVPSCSHPVVRPNQCCPSCEDESGSGQLDGGDLVVCRAPGGEFYVEGETWQLDECTRCTCRKARVLCDIEVCPPVLCQAPSRSKDSCCYICPDDQLKPLLPVNNSQSEFCTSSEGELLLSGFSWKDNPCTSCTCNNGTIQCFSQQCPPANCRVPVLRKGQCCPYCLDMTTTMVPIMLSTQTPREKPTYTEDSRWWFSTTQLPPVVAVTDGKGLGEDFPNQTEVALIYQSAAWILAGILLAIVIFLLVALLINKKKKLVLLSCYNAPKKTVILKKHVNTNAVVYMEPSKENKFQNVRSDCTVSFTAEGSSSNGDRYIIPRAKVNNKQSRLLG